MTIPTRTITLRPRTAAIAALTPLAIVASGLTLAASTVAPAAAASTASTTTTTTITTKLTSLKPTSAYNGWGPVEFNRSVGTRKAKDGLPMKVNGKRFSYGLGVHAFSRVTYALGKKYTTFSTYIGVDDEVGSKGAVRFNLVIDGRTVYASPLMTGRDNARRVSVSVTNAKSLSLVVIPSGRTSYDHGDWGDPMLTAPAQVRRPHPKPSTTTSTTNPSTTTPPTTSPTTSKTSSTTSTTTPPTTSTTTTSSGTPSAFPDASNTGVPAGTTLKASSGTLTLSTDGQVVSGLDITGRVLITASNVTLQRSRITGTTYNIVEVSDSAKNVTIQDVAINGMGMSGVNGSTGIYGTATVLRSNIYGVENGLIANTDSVVRDNYIHGLAAPGDAHYDGIQMDGARNNIKITHNHIDMHELTSTSTVMIDNYFGAISNIAVDNNLLVGGGYTVYSDNRFNSSLISGISFTNNRIGGGHWGYGSIDGPNPVWTGNVDATSGIAIKVP